MNIRNRLHDDQAIEARLAARLAGALTLRLDALPQDVSERLRFAREQAAGRARDVRRAASAGATVVGVSASGAGVLSGFVPWWQRAAAVVPLIMLVAGMLVIDRWAVREHLVAGRLVIVVLNGVAELVPRVIADKIAERDAALVVRVNKSAAVVEEDDPYAAFQIPDDLMW